MTTIRRKQNELEKDRPNRQDRSRKLKVNDYYFELLEYVVRGKREGKEG